MFPMMTSTNLKTPVRLSWALAAYGIALSAIGLSGCATAHGEPAAVSHAIPQPAPPPPVSIPETLDDHLKLATYYQDQAVGYRRISATHARMEQEYENRYPPLKGGSRPGFAEEMIRHCRALMRDLDSLAKDSEDFSSFHRMRAAEMQGK